MFCPKLLFTSTVYSNQASHKHRFTFLALLLRLHSSIEMSTPKNLAAWLIKAGTPLQVGDAPLPTAGPGELVIKNAAIAINPLDCHMQDSGVFVQQWPAIFGCDIAGEVYEVGSGVERFKKGNRVIGYVI